MILWWKPSTIAHLQKPVIKIQHYKDHEAAKKERAIALKQWHFKKIIRKPNPRKIITCTSANLGYMFTSIVLASSLASANV